MLDAFSVKLPASPAQTTW